VDVYEERTVIGADHPLVKMDNVARRTLVM
jgi:hypothetical protein